MTIITTAGTVTLRGEYASTSFVAKNDTVSSAQASPTITTDIPSVDVGMTLSSAVASANRNVSTMENSTISINDKSYMQSLTPSEFSMAPTKLIVESTSSVSPGASSTNSSVSSSVTLQSQTTNRNSTMSDTARSKTQTETTPHPSHMAMTTSNPCSNDNPEWDSETQPCPNSTVDYEFIFEGADATPSPTTTSEESFTISSSSELPTLYSCPGDDGIAVDNKLETFDNSNLETINFRFNYEIYTPPDLKEDDIEETLGVFERKLAYGVARAIRLDDCPQRSNDGKVGSRLVNETRMKKTLLRRSLQNSARRNEYGFVGVSMEPLDSIDTTLLKCTSNVTTLQVANQCTPVHGYMTAWLTSEQAQRLRRLNNMNTDSQLTNPDEYLLTIVQSYMQDNKTSYLTKDLLDVAYVGSRDLKMDNIDPEVLARPRPDPTTTDSEFEDTSYAMYVGIGVGAFFGILLVGLVYAYRRNRERSVELSDESVMDLEEGDGITGAPAVSESSVSLTSLREEDGAFPTVKENPTLVLNDESLQQSDADMASQVSNPPQDPNAPTDNLFGLRGRVCSDEYSETKQPTNEEDDLMEPMSPMKSDVVEGDDTEASTPEEEVDSVAEEKISSKAHVTFPEDVAMSPSEATARACGGRSSHLVPFLMEHNVSTDTEDADDSDGN